VAGFQICRASLVPKVIQTNAITIHAPFDQIWPWLVQLGQAKGGFYSLESLENLVGLDIHNADRIHEEWQNIKPGDPIDMAPPGRNAPPPYLVAYVILEQALVTGHPQNADITSKTWVDVWSFVLKPVDAQTTRLVIRTRTMNVGGIWDIVEPISFMMQRAMMIGIKQRAE
jgi:hypothetical protein